METIYEIGYKEEEVFTGAFIKPWHPKLIKLALWVYSLDIEMIFTSCYRDGDSGVHGTDPLRGFDLRSRVIHDPETVEEITNAHWTYDPKRPSKRVCMLHNVGQGIHFHFQVHPKSEYRG